MPQKKMKAGPKDKKQIQKIVKGTVRSALKYAGESKYLYTNIGTTNFDWTGSIQAVSFVPQGQTDVTRVGDKLMPTSLELRGHMVLAAAGRTFCVGRFLLIRWLQDTDDTSPSVSDILDFTGTEGCVNSSYVHDKRGDFNVLFDTGAVQLNSYGLASYNPSMFMIKKNIRLAGKEIEAVGGTTAGRNHLYVIFVSDVVTANLPYYRITAKLNYKD